VILLFFWLESAKMATDRVRTRVAEGGHDIPEDVIIRRYFSGIRNLFEIYQDLVDHLIIFDNSAVQASIIAEKTISADFQIHQKDKFNHLKNHLYGTL
jgi:predicted ABC-type ATPase